VRVGRGPGVGAAVAGALGARPLGEEDEGEEPGGPACQARGGAPTMARCPMVPAPGDPGEALEAVARRVVGVRAAGAGVAPGVDQGFGNGWVHPGSFRRGQADSHDHEGAAESTDANTA
jgi:hypothetical protein